MDPLMNPGDQLESVLAENQFQQVISEIKASFPVWDEFVFKTGKLQTSIKSLVVMLGSFLETFHKLADIASGTKGGYINEMGVGLAKLGIRQRGIEDKLRSLINVLSESLMGPTQEKLEEWRKSIVCLDKDHKSEFKKAQQDVKKASAETLKLKKKVKKGCKPEVQKQLENSMSDHQSKVQNLEHIRKSFLRSAVGFSRGQYCHLIACFRPLIDIQLSMMTDLSSIQETMDVLIVQSLSPPPTSTAAPAIPNPPSPDTSKGSYQDLFPGKPPIQEESRKSSLSSSSSAHNNVPSPQHQVVEKETLSKKDNQQQLAYRQQQQQPQHQQQHHHHHSCTSYEMMKQQQLVQQPLSLQQQQQQQQQQPQQLMALCHHHNHHHHHHCHHRSPPPGVPSPSSSSSSTSPPPPPLLPTSSSLPSSPIRATSAKASVVTFPSPPPECTCGLNVTAKTSSPYALPLYIGENGCTLSSPGDSAPRASKTTSDYTKLFCTEDCSQNNDSSGGSAEVAAVGDGVIGSGDIPASKSQTVLTLEGYVKMNQLASYYVSRHADAQSAMKKDLSSLQTLKFFKEITTSRPAKTAEDVLDCLKFEIKGQTQPAPRRSNLRDRSLPPSNRKNMRVQFVHQVSSPSSSHDATGKIESPMSSAGSIQQRQQPGGGVKSPPSGRIGDGAAPTLTPLPPLPPPEMLNQQGCFDDVIVDDLPLPPPPEELS